MTFKAGPRVWTQHLQYLYYQLCPSGFGNLGKHLAIQETLAVSQVSPSGSCSQREAVGTLPEGFRSWKKSLNAYSSSQVCSHLSNRSYYCTPTFYPAQLRKKKKQSVEMPVSPSALLQAGCKMPDKIFSDEKILLLICRRDPVGSLVLAVRASAEHSCGFLPVCSM